jgi:metal-responsive CopG/Arc/MetJ family transcriptional regulator
MSVRLPKSLIGELDEIAEQSNWSKNQVIIHFLRWARDEYRRERAAMDAEKKARK